jgi:hypothetical protein
MAQATSRTPVSLHGVTTALMGNCGVTFAPCRPEDKARLAAMMETVEDWLQELRPTQAHRSAMLCLFILLRLHFLGWLSRRLRHQRRQALHELPRQSSW